VTPPGISWTYLKDMTQYLYFWKSPQKIIFDLGNLVSTLGPYSCYRLMLTSHR